jgi:hypothetical protein
VHLCCGTCAAAAISCLLLLVVMQVVAVARSYLLCDSSCVAYCISSLSSNCQAGVAQLLHCIPEHKSTKDMQIYTIDRWGHLPHACSSCCSTNPRTGEMKVTLKSLVNRRNGGSPEPGACIPRHQTDMRSTKRQTPS